MILHLGVYFSIISGILADWVQIPQIKPADTNIETSADHLLNDNPNQFKNLNKQNIPSIDKRILYNIDSNSKPIPNSKNSPTKNIFTNEENIVQGSVKFSEDSGPDIEDETNDAEYVTEETESQEDDKNDKTYPGFFPFLKTIQEHLLKNTHKSVKSKVEVLENLRDGLSFDIDQRLLSLWPTEERQAKDFSDSHLDFPSNEGALITIGFLTLAVFLVKLVLHIIDYKKNYYNNTNTNGVNFNNFGRKRRSVSPDTTYRVLKSVEKYNKNP